MTLPYHPPVKRSLAIHGHKTSISLEPVFWNMLKDAAAREGIALSQLVARIDGERIRASPAPGLAGAIRIWLVTRAGGGEIALADATENGGKGALAEANEKGGKVALAAPAEDGVSPQ